MRVKTFLDLLNGSVRPMWAYVILVATTLFVAIGLNIPEWYVGWGGLIVGFVFGRREGDKETQALKEQIEALRSLPPRG